MLGKDTDSRTVVRQKQRAQNHCWGVLLMRSFLGLDCYSNVVQSHQVPKEYSSG